MKKILVISLVGGFLATNQLLCQNIKIFNDTLYKKGKGKIATVLPELIGIYAQMPSNNDKREAEKTFRRAGVMEQVNQELAKRAQAQAPVVPVVHPVPVMPAPAPAPVIAPETIAADKTAQQFIKGLASDRLTQDLLDQATTFAQDNQFLLTPSVFDQLNNALSIAENTMAKHEVQKVTDSTNLMRDLERRDIPASDMQKRLDTFRKTYPGVRDVITRAEELIKARRDLESAQATEEKASKQRAEQEANELLKELGSADVDATALQAARALLKKGELSGNKAAQLQAALKKAEAIPATPAPAAKKKVEAEQKVSKEELAEASANLLAVLSGEGLSVADKEAELRKFRKNFPTAPKVTIDAAQETIDKARKAAAVTKTPIDKAFADLEAFMNTDEAGNKAAATKAIENFEKTFSGKISKEQLDQIKDWKIIISSLKESAAPEVKREETKRVAAATVSAIPTATTATTDVNKAFADLEAFMNTEEAGNKAAATKAIENFEKTFSGKISKEQLDQIKDWKSIIETL